MKVRLDEQQPPSKRMNDKSRKCYWKETFERPYKDTSRYTGKEPNTVFLKGIRIHMTEEVPKDAIEGKFGTVTQMRMMEA